MILTRRDGAGSGMRRAALATALVFGANGFLLSAWVARLPATRDRLGAGAAELGLALLAPGVGSLLSMPFSGRWCRRFGSRAVVAATTLASAAILAALPLVPTLPAMAAALFVWGAFYGSWDVAMNVHGSAVEQRAGREWMPRYHACWSVGGIVGAGCGALAAQAGVAPGPHFLAVAVVSVVLIGLALRRFVEDRDPRAAAAPDRGSRRRGDRARVLTARLLLVGVVTLCATTIEGAAADWLALFLADERGATDSLAAVGFAVFAVAMAAGRFSGTAVSERLGRHGAVRAGGLVSLAGVLCTVLVPGLAAAYLGAALWALGICLVFPAAVSAGGEAPDRPADAIATVTAIGYGGFLLGPPLIGLLAEQVGLGRALLVLGLLAGAIAALAPAVRSRRPQPAAAASGP